MDTLDNNAIRARREGDEIIIEQPIDDDGGWVQIVIDKSQAKTLAGFLLKATDTRKSQLVEGTAHHFDQFWQLFPRLRRIDKDNCRAKWKRMNCDGHWETIQRHISGLSDKWAEADGRYAPSTTTYLNQKRWEAVEEEEVPQRRAV